MIKVFVIIGVFLVCLIAMTLIFTIGLGVFAWALGCEKSLSNAIKGAFKRLEW